MKILPLFLLALCLFAVTAPAARAGVVINEIMYNSPGSPDVEWIELYNTGPGVVELDDWYLIDSDPTHPHCLLMGDLPEGGYLVVAGDLTAFSAQYPGVTDLNVNAFDPGGNGFGLSNGGDTVNLFDDDGELVDTVAYDDGGDWPGSADGDGPTLELVNPGLDNSVATAWDASLADWGTPAALNSVFQDNQAPIIHDTDRTPRLPQAGDDVLITALVTDATDLDRVELFVDLGSGFASRPMFDDGAHGDGAPADSLFGATIAAQPTGTLVRYYVAAYDDFGNVVTKPADAPASYRAYTVGYNPESTLRINEVMADNGTAFADEFGEFDDWVEIRNMGAEPVNLAGMYLTDDFGDHRNWQLPDVVIEASGFLVVWCDNQPEQGPLHATFKLSGGGEEIALYDTEEHGNTRLHGFRFGLQNEDGAFGLMTKDLTGSLRDDTGLRAEPEYLAAPTPGAANSLPLPTVVINEFQTTSTAGGIDDWIELHNRSDIETDISGWGVSDDPDNPLKWTFPPGTLLPANGYIVVDEEELGFSLSSSGEQIQLCSADGVTALDFLAFDQQEPDISYGRCTYLGNDSFWGFFDPPTPGLANPPYVTPAGNEETPAALHLAGVFPNPFNPATEIRFDLPRQARVTVKVYGLDGRLVRTIDGGVMAAGPAATVHFDGRNDDGRLLASGVYLARLTAGRETAVLKMTLVK